MATAVTSLTGVSLTPDQQDIVLAELRSLLTQRENAHRAASGQLHQFTTNLTHEDHPYTRRKIDEWTTVVDLRSRLVDSAKAAMLVVQGEAA